jgi:hypothetical protein
MRIYFIRAGWKEKHDIWLNLKSDIHRFSFIEMLDGNQITDGTALSDKQLNEMSQYLLTATPPSSHPLTPHKEKTTSTMEYYIGQKVDILDNYKVKDRDKAKYKWRPGEISEIQDCHVHVRYIGWGEEWDEVVDTSVDAKRIKTGGLKIVPEQ